MKVTKLVRNTEDYVHNLLTEKIHNNVRLTIIEGSVTLTGPQHGGINNGTLMEVTTAYDGADYHIRLTVLVETAYMSARKASTYRKEIWYVTF